MQNIILEGKEVEGIVFDVADLAGHLGQLNDPRDNRGKVYPLGIVLSMIVLARLSGQDKPRGSLSGYGIVGRPSARFMG